MASVKIRLGDAISVKHGYAFPGVEFSDDPGYPTLVTPGNFAIGGGFQESKPKTFKGEYPKEFELSPGDLILSMTDLSKDGATLGLPALVPDEGTFLHNQRIGLVCVNDKTKVDARFLNYFLRTSDYRAHILGTASGSTVKHTSPRRICDFVASLPDVSYQCAVAEVLQALDSKIAANDRIASTALRLARATYTRLIQGLREVQMSTVLEPVLGGTPPRSDASMWDGAVPWASARDITGASNGVLLSTTDSITEVAASKRRTRALPKGTVALTARGTVGRVARLGISAAINQSCYGFIPDFIPPGCLFFVVENAVEHAKSMAHGSVFDTITMRTFDHVPIPGLGWSDWMSIEEKISPLLSSSQQAMAESKTLARARDELLPLLMSGKLRVRDSEKAVEEVV